MDIWSRPSRCASRARAWPRRSPVFDPSSPQPPRARPRFRRSWPRRRRPTTATSAIPIWRTGVTVTDFTDVTTRRPAPLATVAYVLYDAKHLYVGVRNEQPGVPITATQSTNDVGAGLDDSDSVSIDTSGSGLAHVHVHRDAARRALRKRERVEPLHAALGDAHARRRHDVDGRAHHPVRRAARREPREANVARQRHAPRRRGAGRLQLGVRSRRAERLRRDDVARAHRHRHRSARTAAETARRRVRAGIGRRRPPLVPDRRAARSPIRRRASRASTR